MNEKLKHLVYAVVASVLWALPAWAGNESTTDAAGAGSPPVGIGTADLLPSLWRLFGALALVLVLAWGTMWIARRVLRGRGAGANRSELKVLDRVYLAPRRSVEIVSIGNRLLVLGVTDQTISMLTELSEEDIARSPAGRTADAVPGAGTRASDVWRNLRRRMGDRLQRVRVEDGAQLPAAHSAAKN